MPAPLRRRSIVEAARRVFLEHGLDGTRTRQIAEAAGVDERLLYHYFESKEALFEAAVLEPLQQMGDELFGVLVEALADGPEQDQPKVQDAVRAVLTTLTDVLPSLGMILYGDDESARRFYRDHYHPLLQRSQGVAAEFASRLTDQPLDGLVVHTLYGTCMNVVLDAWLRDAPLDVDDTADRLSRIFLFGVLGGGAR